MVKKGGMKTKIEIKKITKKTSLGPICVKRRNGLFSKASQLCLLSGAQIAILATPPSSESHVSFYSFGHSSVDGVVSAFLSGQPVPNPEDDQAMREDVGICLTRKDLGLGFWWNNERLVRSEDPREISDAIDSMWTLLGNLKDLRADQASFVNNNNQAFVVNDDHEDLKNNEKSGFTTEEQDQIPPLCESFCVTDNNNNNNSFTKVNLDFDQELDIDQLIDFDTDFESSLDNWYTHQENLDQCFPYIS